MSRSHARASPRGRTSAARPATREHADADGERADRPEPVLEHPVLERRSSPGTSCTSAGSAAAETRTARPTTEDRCAGPVARPTRSRASAAPARCATRGRSSTSDEDRQQHRELRAHECSPDAREHGDAGSTGAVGEVPARAISSSASVAAGYASGSSTRNGEYESAGAAAVATAAKSAYGRETTRRASPYAGKSAAVITSTPMSFTAM